ncbi:MAG: trehalose-phosphatase [Pseudomonadota bacterium]
MRPPRPQPPALKRDIALFLDFDGTLAPIQDDPETVALPRGGGQCLERLSAWLGGAVAVISGRDLRDLSTRLPAGLWRGGGHGLEVCPPGQAPAPAPPKAPARLKAALEALSARHSGTRLEVKGPVFALHFRAAPHHGPALAGPLEAITRTDPDYRLEQGKMIFELKPQAAHKGRALEALLGEAAFAGRMPVMVGDDTTDEDAMAAAMARGGYGVKVGRGDTQAAYTLAGPGEVFAWLETRSQ